MGYNINYTDLRAFQNTVNLLIEGWKQNLQWVLEDINALVNSDSYRGQAADSMRLYLQDVTGNITITLINILCEYSGKLNRYIQGFYAYDNGWQAVLNEDAMQAVMDTFSHIIQETMDSYDRIKDSMDSVSDQLPSSLLTQQAYVVSMIGERDSIYRLRESVGEYDAAAGTEQPTLQEEVETLLQIIKQQVENPPCSVTGYTAEVWQATDTYGDLERIYNASHWYINSHERSILEAQQSYIDTLDRIQEDLSKERWEKGYELVMVSSASALSLVLSSGLLTTGTLTAETAALSTVAAAFVYSDYIEGVQEMYYGCVGDISSASVNPLKDTVFGGWEEGYQAAEMLSIGVASYSGMQDIARAEQAAQLEQIYARKAEQIAYSEVDIDELSNLEWDSGQYAERIEIGSEGGSNSTTVSKLTSADVKAAIEKNGMSVEDFSKLLDPNRMLTPDELKFVDKVRADIGLPEVGTVMNKTIPQSDIYNYLYNENYSGVRGFVSVDEHSNTLKTLDDVFEGNRLDYNNTAFKIGSGVDGISKSVGNADTVYGKITYVLDDADGIKVPEDFSIEANAPYTGRGFTGSKNIVLPELVQDTRPFVDGDILSIYDAETGVLTQQFIYDSDLGWVLK